MSSASTDFTEYTRKASPAVAASIRAALPARLFRNTPGRTLWIVPLACAIVTGSIIIARVSLSLWILAALSVAIGLLYASLFFYGHELAHGAMTRNRMLQTCILYAAFLIFCLSPHLWSIWHVQVHHGYTNEPGRDPDHFGTTDDFWRHPSNHMVLRFAPGSGHWLSVFFLLIGFPIHVQGVLWVKSARLPGFDRLRRRRACLDSAVMLSIWVAVFAIVGAVRGVFIVLIPMVVANFAIMSYIGTNHLLRPLAEGAGPLETSMSITSPKWCDLLFFHFSHHIEHHLFPAMATCFAPLVRRALIEQYGARYLAPPHFRALRLLFVTPRLYEGDRLVDPWRRRYVYLSDVDSALRDRTRLRSSLRGATRRDVPQERA